MMRTQERKVKIARHCVFFSKFTEIKKLSEKEEAAQAETLKTDGEKSSPKAKNEMMKRENNQHIKRALN